MKNNKVRKSKEYKLVYEKGKSYGNKYLIMYVIDNLKDNSRLGISVSKKVGNSVVRHRITRLIRESYRLNDEKFENGFDIVVIARQSAKGKSYREIESALMHLARLHKIKKDTDLNTEGE